MINYRVRSISLLNLINDVKTGRLIPDAYFQRNLVWREIHKKDFIKTILLGFPFPQIFISKGKVNVSSLSTVSCIVDGQQRTDAIMNYLDNNFDVDGRLFSTLSDAEKSSFLKYEIAVIELDLENDDPLVREIFQRINRTSNSLTLIEKLASAYSTSEYMLVGRLLADQINIITIPGNSLEDFKEDPNIPDDFFVWARYQRVEKFKHLITNKSIFSATDLAKKAHLMHVLNIMSTILTDFFNRNEKTNDLLNDYALNFDVKDEIVAILEDTANLITSLKLKQKSFWLNKSNIFSLIVAIGKRSQDINLISIPALKAQLEEFELNIPSDYKLASTEAVNNKRERELRHAYINELIDAAIF